MTDVEDFFKTLGYGVYWGQSGVNKWWEIHNKDNKFVVQFDQGIPLEVILKDFEGIWNGSNTLTSGYNYIINTMRTDPYFKKLLDEIFGKQPIKLHEVSWSLIGSTNEFKDLKRDIGHVCQDVTNAACIDEICIMDIVNTFKKHGYVITKEDS